jgi:S-adenosylmethionine decarboxylase proenzyme
MDGLHLIGDWYECPEGTPELDSAGALRELCLSATAASGLTAVAERFHQFEPQGVTGTVLLGESHLAIHTWPESGYVSVDVFVCNRSAENSGKAQALFAALRASLKPVRVYEQAVRRGARDAIRRVA